MFSRSTLGLCAALVTVVSWAASFPLIGVALGTFDPIPLAAVRFAIAACPAVVWLLIVRPPLPRLRDLGRLALGGAIGISLYNWLLNTGQQTVSPGAASFIINTLPIWTALLATIFLRERFGFRAWIATAVSFSGVFLIAQGQPGEMRFGNGSSLILLASILSASYFVLVRDVIARYGAGTCTCWTLITGALWLSPWLPDGLAQLGTAPVSVISAVLFLGLISASLGYATWSFAIGHFGPALAANFLYLVPPLAIGLAWSLSGITPDVLTIAGGGVAIGGVIMFRFWTGKVPRKATA
ncbi:DMT family transporter [Thalassospira lucentensis]|uniref:DMT family transporter n=1 Tax=Thalassospira lucentensis TaxID=168935 RepID=UPI003D2EEDE5